MKLSIIGTGYVGLVTGTCFAEMGNEVLCIDSDRSKVDLLRKGGCPIFEPGLEEMVRDNVSAGRLRFGSETAEAVEHGEVIFIAVNTPAREDGRADLTDVEAVARQIADHLTAYRIVVEKSTVPVRTGQKVMDAIRRYNRAGVDFDVASNPEFLREGSAIDDFMHPDRVVLGVASPRPVETLRSLYEPLGRPILVTDINSAELIKHASNSFLAMKISYINAVARICELSGADVREVAEGMGLDRRIGPEFLQAGIGFGGSCFPKDVAAFIRIASDLGYDFELLKTVQRINRTQHLWPLEILREELWVLKGKRIGLLGLAFKPNTDDLRNAPSLVIARELLSEGAEVIAHDPAAAEAAADLLPELTVVGDAADVARGADAVVLVTDWPEYQRLDWDRFQGAMSYPLFIDGRNACDPDRMREVGFVYRCVGRASN